MYSVEPANSQADTYVLTDGAARSRAEVVPSRGGILTRWQVGDRDVLYFDAERFADPSLSVRGGIPILFPICGNLPGDRYTLADGRSFSLKQHGFARDLPWTVGDRATADAASLTLTLESCDRTRAVYPFEFTLEFTYRLWGNSLEIRQRYHNRSDEPMPFSTGLHPYFNVADKTQLRLDFPATEYLDQKSGDRHPFSGSLDFERPELDLAFLNPQRAAAAVSHRDRRDRLELTWDEHLYGTLVFWTLQDKAYYCLEPWSAGRNALNTGEQLQTLAPGASLNTWVRLAIAPEP